MLINCHTYYSLKYGTVSIEEMYAELKKGGHKAFALTDINNTSACIYTLKYSKLYGINATVGVDFRNGTEQQYVCIANVLRIDCICTLFKLSTDFDMQFVTGTS